MHRNPDPVDRVGVLAPAAQTMLQHQRALRESVGQVVLPGVRMPQIRCSTLLALLAECPRTSSLVVDGFPEYVDKVLMPPSGPCTNLRSLVILLDIIPVCASACVFRILRHLPRLRVLHVGSTAGASYAFPSSRGREPLGIPLESFTYSGLIDGSACAHIITSSGDTLTTLRIVDIAAVSKGALLLVIPAVMDAAPRLTELALSFPDSGVFDKYAEPLVAALRAIKRLSVSARAAATLWRIARNIGRTRCRDLELHAVAPSDAVVGVPRNVLLGIGAARLRTLTLTGLGFSDETARDLEELCCARRVQCIVLP